MRTLILHLTNGETKEVDIPEKLNDASLFDICNDLEELQKEGMFLVYDYAAINLNHIVWMEEK